MGKDKSQQVSQALTSCDASEQQGRSSPLEGHSPTWSENWGEILANARAGSLDELGQLLNLGRELLRRTAEVMTPRDLQACFDPSDLVQESLCEARAAFGEFRGETPAEWRAWLKRILINNVLNQYRRYRGTKMRDRQLEVSLDQGQVAWQDLADPASTPSKAVMRREDRELLERSLEKMPEDYRTVIVLRHREGLGFAEIGQRMSRSEDAARMLWSRAFERLASLLESVR